MIANFLLVAIAGIPLSMFIAAIYMDYYDGIKMASSIDNGEERLARHTANAPKKVDEAIEELQ